VTAALVAYVAAWNCPDPSQCAELLARCWTAQATYTDPAVRLTGAGELAAHIASRQAARPGAVVEIVGEVRSHHEWATFAWRVRHEAAVPVSGIDCVEFAADGRLNRVVGFFDPPAGAAG
jgi:hypothetical protein